MGYITVIITLTVAGTDTGPFDIYTDADNFIAPIIIDLTQSQLLSGYTCTIVPDTATIIRVQSNGVCTNYIDLPISGLNIPTPTPTPTHTPTPTPTHTPTPTPTPSPAAGNITISLQPVTTVYNQTTHNKKTAILTLSQPLAPGQSFRLYFTNYAFATGTSTGNIVANAGRNLNGNQTTDRAHADIPAGQGGTAIQTKNGYVIVNSTNIINNLYFYVDVFGGTPSPEYEAQATSTLTSAVAETGGGTYTINPNYNTIDSYINP
jgi:hypothetical protein